MDGYILSLFAPVVRMLDMPDTVCGRMVQALGYLDRCNQCAAI